MSCGADVLVYARISVGQPANQFTADRWRFNAVKTENAREPNSFIVNVGQCDLNCSPPTSGTAEHSRSRIRRQVYDVGVCSRNIHGIYMSSQVTAS